MNYEDFLSELSHCSGCTDKETSLLVASLVDIIGKELQNGNIIDIHDFGSFEVLKELEYITYNPSTQQRLLVPPKLVIKFKQKDKLKNDLVYE